MPNNRSGLSLPPTPLPSLRDPIYTVDNDVSTGNAIKRDLLTLILVSFGIPKALLGVAFFP